MFSWYSQRKRRKQTAITLYTALVEQSRRAEFYADFAVPDTMEGRFEMVLLHLFVVQNRLMAEGAEARQLSQALSEVFISEMDSTMREQGVGDLAVPKRMRKVGEAYLGRLQSYRDAIGSEDPASLPAALIRNIWTPDEADGIAPPVHNDRLASAEALAGYVHSAIVQLEPSPYTELSQGRIAFPAL